MCGPCATSFGYHIASKATRHAVRLASAPNSSARVPDPAHPAQPASAPGQIGTNQLGTRPVASHCASCSSRYDVSISASHLGARRAPSAGVCPNSEAYASMKSRITR